MKKIYFIITFLFLALFSASFDINESRAFPQCFDGVNNDFPSDMDVDFEINVLFYPPTFIPPYPNIDTDCCCHLDNTEDSSVETGPLYISFQNEAETIAFVTEDCSLDTSLNERCDSFDGDLIGCATGWNCPVNAAAGCFVDNAKGLEYRACENWTDGINNVCNTVYEACGCVCCTAAGVGCANNGDCCSNNCVGLVCVATTLAGIGEACTDDSDCASNNCDTVAGVCIAAVGGGAGGVCPDGNCEYDLGENMFNCPEDCLPAGVPSKLIPDVINDIIRWLLTFAISVAVLILIYGGVYYSLSSGDTQKTESAKKIIKYALLGILIVGISYAIITVADKVFH